MTKRRIVIADLYLTISTGPIQSFTMTKRAFSIIELVIVIAVVALILAISTSTLNRVRQKGRTLLCQSRVRQWQIALLAYDQREATLPYGYWTNKDMPAPPGGRAGSGGIDWYGWWWFHYLGFESPHPLDPSLVFECPSKELGSYALQNNELWGNYGVNWSLCKNSSAPSRFKEFIGTPLSTMEVKHPSSVMLLGDSGYALLGWYHATQDSPNKLQDRPGFDTSYVPGLSINRDRLLLSAQNEDALRGRHPNKTINVGYVDGHVANISAEETRVDKEGDSYRNVSPFWDSTR